MCGNEGDVCACLGMVRYGADNRWSDWVDTGASGSIECSNKIFGDPDFGTKKHCECQPRATSEGVTWTHVAIGYGGCIGGDWMKIGTASSLEEAKELMLSNQRSTLKICWI